MIQQGKAPSINYVMMKEEAQTCPVKMLRVRATFQNKSGCSTAFTMTTRSYTGLLLICHRFTCKRIYQFLRYFKKEQMFQSFSKIISDKLQIPVQTA